MAYGRDRRGDEDGTRHFFVAHPPETSFFRLSIPIKRLRARTQSLLTDEGSRTHRGAGLFRTVNLWLRSPLFSQWASGGPWGMANPSRQRHVQHDRAKSAYHGRVGAVFVSSMNYLIAGFHFLTCCPYVVDGRIL
ncbi:MAG: hypothetical protein ABSH25_15395 [Syntrophorhabdales bacterium]|jgi:hypothetical protein